MTSLNHILARWLDDQPAPPVDCAGCARPAKCCDFQPFVPNFLIGAALERGLDLASERWRFHAQPLGLIPSQAFRARRGEAAATCAFYTLGRCAIWNFRPGECSGFNCARETPKFTAATFAFETTLAQMALVELGFEAAAVSAQIDILNDPGEDLGHASNAAEIYARAWDWARGLSRSDIDAWLEDV